MKFGQSKTVEEVHKQMNFITKKTMTNEDINFDLIFDEDLAQNRYPLGFVSAREQLTKGGHCSLAAKTVTPEMFEALKDKTTSNGWTLARAINTGALNLKSFVGCHAGDLESYEVF